MPSYSKACERCGKDFRVHTRQVYARQRFCSRSCASSGRCDVFWAGTTAEQRHARAVAMSRKFHANQIARLLQRVKVLADTEDERIVLAWRYGKRAAGSDRYRAKTQVSA